MKQFIYILALALGVHAIADDLTIKDGTVFHNVSIISVNPEQMLIVHDGGGCQVKFAALVPDSLTAAQRQKVEEELKYYTERKARIDKAATDRKAFVHTQMAKGLIEFEGAWMTPQEKEMILQVRAERKLALERQRLQLAQKRAQLEKEQLETERARYLLEGERNRGTTITGGYFSSYHRSRGTWYPYYHGRDCSDKNRYNRSLYTRNNFTGPPGSSGGRVYIDAGRPLTYSSGIFTR